MPIEHQITKPLINLICDITTGSSIAFLSPEN